MDRKLKYFIVIALAAVAAFLVVALATSRSGDWPFAGDQSWRHVRNLSGPLGSAAAWGVYRLLGPVFAWFVPFWLVILSAGIALERRSVSARLIFKTLVFIVLVQALLGRISFTRESAAASGMAGRELGTVLSAVRYNRRIASG